MDENSADPAGLDEDRTLLIADDDKPFLARLARAMEGRGFIVETAESVQEALIKVRQSPPAYAVVDMRFGDGNGLDIVAELHSRRANARAIVLTGYGNIATAVTAVKLGAIELTLPLRVLPVPGSAPHPQTRPFTPNPATTPSAAPSEEPAT